MCVFEKKGKEMGSGGGGSKWSGSVSVTVNLLNHLPPSNKIEHQAELNNCQTPPEWRGDLKKGGRVCFSREGRWKHFNVVSRCCGGSAATFGQGELKEPLSGKSSMTFISWGDGGMRRLLRRPGNRDDIERMWVGKWLTHTYGTFFFSLECC